ncbi:hypothetical protein ACHAWO_003281 [Cyclotella atomus]|uniref:RmlD-like substrate binding domain-containing protein n=1 Tax=Cyclotella atomus TaxID=382360 RepID=A0ABD3MZ93_9STRA
MTSVKKILITGSSGYVGQHLLSTLARHGVTTTSTTRQYEVYCAYNSLSTFESDLHQLCSEMLHPSIVKMTPFPLDFTTDIVSEIKSVSSGNIDVIIHLAALSSPFYCESHADEAWCINVPVKLLELNAPIVYMSTDQVYAGTKQYYKEEDETLPVNLYGRTKLAFERVLLQQLDGNSAEAPLLTKDELGDSTLPSHLSASKLKDLKQPHPPSVILRSSLILGKPTPLAHGCKKGSFPSFMQFVQDRLQSNTETDYFTNEYRSMVHVRDVVKAILHFTKQALTSKSEGEESGGVKIYNLGGSERVNRYELAVKIANHLKIDGSCVKGVDRQVDGGGVPSPPDISMNVDKLIKELGAERLDGLNDIIRSTFALD